MAKVKAEIPMPKAEDVPSAKKMVEQIDVSKKRVATLKEPAKDGKFNKYDPKYRQALKRLKRGQRALKRELLRVKPKTLPAAAPEGGGEGGGEASE